jgi:hypothetical protein
MENFDRDFRRLRDELAWRCYKIGNLAGLYGIDDPPCVFWIAPFYGFFHAPWFLAQAIALPCDGFAQAVVVGIVMAVATHGAHRTAVWMFR